MFKEINLWYI